MPMMGALRAMMRSLSNVVSVEKVMLVEELKTTCADPFSSTRNVASNAEKVPAMLETQAVRKNRP